MTEDKKVLDTDMVDPEINDEFENTMYNFKKEPQINVIPKEVFDERAKKVFKILWQTLSKSFGPYGAPTLIYNYPYSHVTKDGFTIMKNLSMNAVEGSLDQSIADMASDICGRLNYTVGDGTTSAVIATNSIYQSYLLNKDKLVNDFILPRDIMKAYNEIKEDVIKELSSHVKPIRSEDMEELKKNIHKVVYISSNGDDEITNYISDIYGELGCPGITSTIAPDGITKKTIINGYKYNAILNDKVYINSDDNTMELADSDIIIFLKRVTLSTYDNILVPLNEQSRLRGRHLIVFAPMYDEAALKQRISPDLMTEYMKEKDINMVLMGYKNTSSHMRNLLEDFAMLVNTKPISSEVEQQMLDDINRGLPIFRIFNIDGRGIDGSTGLAYKYDEEAKKNNIIKYIIGEDSLNGRGFSPLSDEPGGFRLGFVRGCSLGLKSSLFKGDFVYNENLYNKMLEAAKLDLVEKERKYQKLGTFNLEVSEAQERLYALNLKMGCIEVGGDSELSQRMLKDQVDDAIKAANSAFIHGTVLGCNVDLITVLEKLKKEHATESSNDMVTILYDILYNGFIDVYKTVLMNAFRDIEIDNTNPMTIAKEFKNFILRGKNYKKVDKDTGIDDSLLIDVIKSCIKEDPKYSFTIHDLIVKYSIASHSVFDVSTFTFTDKVINSVETDEQILRATTDLISILIVGNQMVVTGKNNF